MRLAHRRCFTEAQQRMVIFLRFGSLTSMKRQCKTPKEVHQQTGVRPSSQWNIIRRWREQGHRVISLIGLRGKKLKLSYEQ